LVFGLGQVAGGRLVSGDVQRPSSKPPVPRRSATVWYCDDEVCNCSQAIVEDIERHPTLGGNYVKRTRVATGRFYTDGEGFIDNRHGIERDHLALLYGAWDD
jgi:hypothetical protein